MQAMTPPRPRGLISGDLGWQRVLSQFRRCNSISRVDEIESVPVKVAFQFVDPVLSVSEDLENNLWLVACVYEGLHIGAETPGAIQAPIRP